MRIRHAVLIGLVVIGSGAARAHPYAGDPTEGRALARVWCSSCHIVEPEQRHAGNDAIPGFPAIAQMPSTTAMSLQAFLQTSHPPMPDVVLNRRQIGDVVAYILSLRQR